MSMTNIHKVGLPVLSSSKDRDKFTCGEPRLAFVLKKTVTMNVKFCPLTVPSKRPRIHEINITMKLKTLPSV